jgi:Flp pilus assembly protein TadD
MLALVAVPSLAQTPSAADYFKSSRAHMQQGDFAGAIADLDKAVALKPESSLRRSARRAHALRDGSRRERIGAARDVRANTVSSELTRGATA